MGNQADWSAIRLSLEVALWATLLTLPPSVLLGYVLSRRRFVGRTLVEWCVHLPLVLPPTVTGYLLLVIFGKRGLVGSWIWEIAGVSIAFTFWGAVLASAVVSLPLFVRPIRLGFDQIDRRLEMAARTLGAGPWSTFWRISLPLSWRGIVAGGILGFARSLGEFGATILLAGNIVGETQTIPLAIYARSQLPGGMEGCGTLVLASLALSGFALLMGERLQREAPW